MSKRRMNKLFVTLGLLFAGNGLLLTATPGRFASLRTMGWLPEQYNTALERFTSHAGLARATGAITALLGVTLVTVGMKRTRPTT